jgi:hypothetical protein
MRSTLSIRVLSNNFLQLFQADAVNSGFPDLDLPTNTVLDNHKATQLHQGPKGRAKHSHLIDIWYIQNFNFNLKFENNYGKNLNE